MPNILKCALTIPIPKCQPVSSLNDYRPVALTCIVVKILEQFVLSHLRSQLPPSFFSMIFCFCFQVRLDCLIGGCGNNKGRGISATVRSASNLLKHVENRHKLQHEEVNDHVGHPAPSMQIDTALSADQVPEMFKKFESYFQVMTIEGNNVSTSIYFS